MDILDAVSAFSALSQETRLRVFTMLAQYGKEGSAAGDLSAKLKIPHNTLSFHLSHLSKARLITSLRQGRSIIYMANTDTADSLIKYLKENYTSKKKTRSLPKSGKTKEGK